MSMLDILVALAIVAVAVALKQIVEAIDDQLYERDEIKSAESHNRLITAQLRGEREAREGRYQVPTRS